MLTWNSRCGRGAISFPSSNSASTKKRLEVFEADEAALLGELRNYSQHKFLPYLAPSFHFSQGMPMAEFQFRLEVEPLLKWDKWVGKVRKYSESKANSIDILTIIGRYSKSVREFYEWFWLKIDEKMKPERVECHAHVRELMAYGEEVFLVLAGHAVSIVDPDASTVTGAKMASAGERHDVLVEDHLVGVVGGSPARHENQRNPLALCRIEVGGAGHLTGDREPVVERGQTLRRER